MVAKNESRNTVLSGNLTIANSFAQRFWGLMFRNGLPDDCGLLIKPCNSIHMFFMKFPLDVVFVDSENRVVHLIENMLPWKCSRIVFKSQCVLELPVGTIRRTGTQIGDKIRWC